MLIEVPFKNDDIVSLKLGNGDELIGKLNSFDDKFVNLVRPLLMVLTQDQRTGQPAAQMVPFWMLGSDKEGKFPINRSHIVCILKSTEEAKAGYLELTTGLAIPKGSSKLVV